MPNLIDLFHFFDSIEITSGTMRQVDDEQFTLTREDQTTENLSWVEAETLLARDPDLAVTADLYIL